MQKARKLIDVLASPKKKEKMKNCISEPFQFCTVFESQWVENSKNKYQESCRQNQMTGQMIQCILDGGKGDYKLYPKVKNEIHELQIQRVKYLLMANFELTLEPSAVKSILMFFYIKIGISNT